MLVPVLFVTLLFKITSFCFAEDIRLKQDVIPNKYDIELSPDFENAVFTGKVSIDISVNGYTSSITLHATDLTIGQTKLKSKVYGTFEDIPVRSVNKTGDDSITVNLREQILMGDYVLEINFNGAIREDMTGFYRSYYYYEGNKRWLGATQFEPYYARRAFPCFDEPSYRANFALKIFVPSTHEVVSNVEPSQQSFNGGYNFENYPSMPTYLLAWVIFERYTFVSTEPYSLNGTKYRLWTQADYANQTSHSNFVASRLLNALSTYLDVPYTLNKMDQFAIPDFSAGAMENWGAVTYREAALLYTDKISTTEDYKKITAVIAHEFTHQWFGNLVTLDWWSYTWLNEAFATYFQYFITLEVYTDWRLDEQFIVTVLQPALAYDSSPQTAMTSDIGSLADINKKFDTVTYNKGASVVRMMDHILTRQNFKAGLSRYLRTVSAKRPVATPNDLFKILSHEAPTELPYKFETIMRSWTDQAGYPVVTVKRQRDNTILLSQKRGLYKEESSNTMWYIPLTYTTQREANFTNTAIRDWLTTAEKNLSISLSPNDWIIFNIQHKGFYRVNYDAQSWRAIINQLQSDHSKIRSLNRAQLIDDTFFFAKAGLLDLNTSLTITSYLTQEIDYAPWQPAVRGFNDLLDQYYGVEEVRTLLKKYSLLLLSSVLRNVGFVGYDGDKMAQKLKRVNVLKFAGSLEHPGAVSTADQIVKDLVQKSKTSYSPDIQQALLCTGLRKSNSTTWNSIYTLYKKTPYPTQKILYLYSLTCVENPDLLKTLIKDTISADPTVRRQDASRLFSEISSTPYGANVLLEYLKDATNVQALITYNFKKPKIIADIISGISKRIYTTTDRDAITKINTDNQALLKEETYNRITKIVEQIDQAFETTSKNKDTIKNFLSQVDFNPTTPATSPTTSRTNPVTSGTVTSTTPKQSSSGVKNVHSFVLIISIVFYHFL